MDFILLLSLALLPISAWVVWLWLWKWSGTNLIVLTCVTGVVLYVFATYAIRSNSEAWVKTPIQAKVGMADGELAFADRQLASFTQLTLPAMISLWFAVVFCAGAISEHFLMRFGFNNVGFNNITSQKDQDPEQLTSCSNCGRSHKVQSALVGLTGACPNCNEPITFQNSETAG